MSHRIAVIENLALLAFGFCGFGRACQTRPQVLPVWRYPTNILRRERLRPPRITAINLAMVFTEAPRT